jgi:Saxitoxin biosynthesis operon protein SxtJ
VRWSDVVSPTNRVLREFGALLALAGILSGVWFGIDGEDRILLSICGLLVVVGMGGLFWPWLLRPIFVGWMVLVYPVAWVVSIVLLAVVFFGLITPLAILFRLLGRDALSRTPCPDRESYWEELPAAPGPARYLRQF